MLRIALINMPFAGLQLPSLALTEIKAVVDAEFKEQVSVEVLYFNQEFARLVGVDFVQNIAMSSDAHNSGLGDWYFSQAAFPEVPDNSETYFRRFFPARTGQMEAFKRRLVETRRTLSELLDQMIVAHRLDRADIVGLTSMFSQNTACFALARRLKLRNPEVLVVMGGANCEPPMGQEIVRNVEAVDFVFGGPGLRSFPEFVRHGLEQKPDKRHTIRGVLSRSNTRFALAGAAQGLGEELDVDAPLRLDFDGFLDAFQKNVGNELKPVLLLETSRGCWWGERAHCTFCGLNGLTMKYRAMSPENAIRQFESLFRYSDRVERIESVDNIVPKHYLTEVFPRLKTPPGVSIFYEVKADLSDEDVRTLAEARVRFIQPGIEALATSTLKLMKKGTSAFQNVALLRSCATYGVQPAWNLLIGFPGEDEQVYRKYTTDIPLLVHLPPPNGVFPVRFDRYSPYFVQAQEYGLDLSPLDYYEMVYPFESRSLANLAYYFTDRNVGAVYVQRVSKWIGKLRHGVGQWQSRWSAATGGGEVPKLFFRSNGASTLVHDTRSGKLVEHEVGAVGKRVLEHLVKPKRLADLSTAWDGPRPLDPAGAVAALQDRGLVFQEGDRYLSLVLRDAPALTNMQG